MRVAEIRGAQYGDVLQFRPLSLKGEAIRWADSVVGAWRDNGLGSGSPYSHTAVYDRLEHGQHWIFESDGAGVRHSVLLTELGNFDIYRPEGDATPRPRREVAAICNRRKYDYFGILRVFFYYITGREQDWSDLRRLWCSEFANWVWRGSLVTDGPATPRTVYAALR